MLSKILYPTFLLITPIFLSLDVVQSQAQTRTRITASDADPEDQFGSSLAIDGDVAIIGAWADDETADNAGAAYVFRFDGTDWVEEAKLLAPDGASGDAFGSSVSVDGDLAAVAAEGDEDLAGSIHLFRHDGAVWRQEAKIVRNDNSTGRAFGQFISLSENRLLASAIFNDEFGQAAGTVYVFTFDGTEWWQEAKLIHPDAADGDRFGISVSLDGDIAAAGALTSDAGPESGSVHVFRLNGSTWNYETKLTAPDAAEGDRFGTEVSLSGTRILVGAPFDSDQGDFTGSVHAFHLVDSEWTHEAKISPDDAAPDQYFGRAVSHDGDRLIVGGSTDLFAVYSIVYADGAWVQESKLPACEGACPIFDQFGEEVHVSGERAIVGSTEEDDEAGAVYIYELGPVSTHSEADAQFPDAASIKLEGSYPNPVVHGTTIGFSLDRPSYVRLSIVDVLGRERAVLLDRPFSAGAHRITYSTDLEAGTYIYRLDAGGASRSRLMTVAK